MKYLLDTNVFSELGRSKRHGNLETDVAQQIEQVVTTVLEAFGDRVLAIDQDVARLWGEMLGVSYNHVDDAGLAATAMVHGLVLVTRNVKDFTGVTRRHR